MTSSSSLYGTVTTQNASSTNSTSLYGGADTPIPDSSGNVIVRGDLYVLSGNILTTATTGNIFPANATTINLGLAATAVNIGAGTGTTTINNNLVVDGTVEGNSADFGNITIAVADDQTITTTTGELRLSSTSGNIRLPSITSINTDTTGSFGFLNQPTTINAFTAATTLNLGANTGTTNINNDLLVEGTGTFTGDITATGGKFGNISVGEVNNNTIYNDTTDLYLTSVSDAIGLGSTDTLYSTSSSFNLLNSPTTVVAFDSATALTLADTTGTTFIRNDVSVGGDLKVNGNNIKSNGGTTAITLSGANVTVAGDLTVNGTIINGGSQFGNITVGVTDDNTIDTTTGDLNLTSANGVIGMPGVGTLYSDQSSFLLLNAPTTVTAFDSATTLTLADTTGTTFIRNDVSVGGNLKVNGNTIKSNGGTTAITMSGADVGVSGDLTVYGGDLTVSGNGYIYSATGLALDLTGADTRVANDLTVSGDNINLAQSTLISYSENNNRANRPEVQSTTGNSSGWRVIAPNATTSANSNLTVFNTNDIDNGQFLSVQAIGSTTAPFNIRTGTYTGGVLSASNDVISFVDGTTTYATLNPAGPTNSTDLATKSYVDSHEANTTYTIDASSTTGGANFNLVGSDLTTDTIKFSGSGATTVTQTSANEITVSSTDTNTTYTQDVSSTTGGANLNLVGSDLTTDSVKFAGGTNVSVVATDASTVTINATDTNTTYDFNATSTTGGANLNLVGSDSTTDTVKISNGTGVTVSQVSGTEVSVAIGQAVGTGDSVTFADVTANGVIVGSSANTISGTTLAINGATSGGGSVTLNATDTTPGSGQGQLTLNTSSLTYTHTDGALVPGVTGTWSFNADGSTNFPSYKFPYADGSANQVLTTDGAGNVTWALPGGGGSTFGNVSIGVDTDQTISTTSGNLILQTAAGVSAGTITLAAGANGNITLSPNGTGVVSSGVTQLATASRTLGTHLGTQSTTWTPPASGLTNLTSQNGFFASSSSGGANGAGSAIQSRYYSGDTTAGTNISASLLGGGATGTNSSPAALANGQVLLTINADGYATTGWAGTIATGTQTPTGVPIMPAQLQFYSREAFADNGTNVTAGGTGMRVRLFNAATTYTAANRVNIIDHTTTAATYKAVTFNIQPAASTNNYATFGATTGSINQDTFTLKNNAATTTYATFNSTSASINGDTTTVKNTAGTTTYASFASGGASLGYVDAPVLFDRTTAGTPGVANQKNAFIIESRRSDQTGVTDTDLTGNNFRVGGTSNYYWTNQIQSQYKTSGDHIYTLQAAAGDQTSASPSWLTLATFAPTQTIIRAGTAGSGGSTATKLTVDASKITAAVPVVFPSYTAAQANAITGAIGWQIAISDSAGGSNPNGMMAFWDTTNARWSYIHDNSAV